MKEVMSCKGLGGQGGGIKPEHWFRSYEFAGTHLESFPIAQSKPLAFAQQLDNLGQKYTRLLPEATVQAGPPVAERLAEDGTQAKSIRGRMIALQEELDWQCYNLYSLLPDNHRHAGHNLPALTIGQRTFEIVMSNQTSTECSVTQRAGRS